MNIEESIIEFKKMIERDKDTLRYWKSDTFGHYDEPIKKLEKDVLISETLLTAYEKEKGENVKLRLQDIPLIEGELKAYKDRVNELKSELEKEKEKNKELIKQHAIEITDVGGNSIKIDLDGKIHNVYKIKEE